MVYFSMATIKKEYNLISLLEEFGFIPTEQQPKSEKYMYCWCEAGITILFPNPLPDENYRIIFYAQQRETIQHIRQKLSSEEALMEFEEGEQ
jgi:hypothetical protein